MAVERYECTIPPHNKFWEIELSEDERSFTTWWGPIGENPRGNKTRRFSGRSICLAAYNTIIRRKRNKGYQHIRSARLRPKPSKRTRKEKPEEKKKRVPPLFDVFGKM